MDCARTVPPPIKKIVHTLLLSKPQGVLVSEFLTEFKNYVNNSLDYKSLGFSSISEFIRALPDVVSLKYSEIDMAYLMFAQQNSTLGNCSVWTREDEDQAQEQLIPNNRGLYTLFYPHLESPYVEDAVIKAKFAPVAEVAAISLHASYVFVRFQHKESAIKALRMFRDELNLKVATEKAGREQRFGMNQGSDNRLGFFNYRNNLYGNYKKFSDSSFDSRDLYLRGMLTGKGGTRESDKNNGVSPKGSGYHANSEISGFRETSNLNASSGSSGFKESEMNNPHFRYMPIGSGGGYKPLVSKKNNGIHSKKFAPGAYPRTAPAAQNRNGNYPNQSVILYVGNVPYQTTEAEVIQLFQEFGIMDFKMEADGKKTSAYVKVPNEALAIAAFDMWNKKVWKGRPLIIKRVQFFGSDKGNKSESTPAVAGIQLNKGVAYSDGHSSLQNKVLEAFGSVSLLDHGSGEKPKVFSSNSAFTENLNYAEMPELEEIDGNDSGEDKVTEEHSKVTLFVGNFPYGTTEVDLMRLFANHNPTAAFIRNRVDRNRSTFGFITMPDIQNAEQAILELDQSEFNGRILLVTSASNDPILKSKNLSKNCQLKCTIQKSSGDSRYQRSVEMPRTSSSLHNKTSEKSLRKQNFELDGSSAKQIPGNESLFQNKINVPVKQNVTKKNGSSAKQIPGNESLFQNKIKVPVKQNVTKKNGSSAKQIPGNESLFQNKIKVPVKQNVTKKNGNSAKQIPGNESLFQNKIKVPVKQNVTKKKKQSLKHPMMPALVNGNKQISEDETDADSGVQPTVKTYPEDTASALSTVTAVPPVGPFLPSPPAHFPAFVTYLSVLERMQVLQEIEEEVSAYSGDIQVAVVSVADSSHFWGQVLGQNNNIEILPEIMSELQLKVALWNVATENSKCAALFEKEWFRAYIVSEISQDMVDVFFLDFGNTCVVSRHETKSIPDSFWKILPMARPFVLSEPSQSISPGFECNLVTLRVTKKGSAENNLTTEVCFAV